MLLPVSLQPSKCRARYLRRRATHRSPSARSSHHLPFNRSRPLLNHCRCPASALQNLYRLFKVQRATSQWAICNLYRNTSNAPYLNAWMRRRYCQRKARTPPPRSMRPLMIRFSNRACQEGSSRILTRKTNSVSTYLNRRWWRRWRAARRAVPLTRWIKSRTQGSQASLARPLSSILTTKRKRKTLLSRHSGPSLRTLMFKK